MISGPRNLITDVSGLRVGNAENAAIKTGTTVLLADAPFTTSVAVHGGAPGTRETDLLAPDKSAPGVDALVLSGGSAFGLAAAQGVMDALHEQGRGFEVFSARVPIVPAAGSGAQTAMHKGGLGSASLVLPGGVTVGALVAVNPMGSVTTPSGQHFWAAPFEYEGEFGGLGVDTNPGMELPPSRKVPAMASLGNTTIAIVATDAAMDKAQCHRMAVAAHDGMARAILPAHSPMDGDLVFASSTGAVALTDPGIQLAGIGHAASLCLARAIARAVWEARPEPGDTLPTLKQDLGLT